MKGKSKDNQMKMGCIGGHMKAPTYHVDLSRNFHHMENSMEKMYLKGSKGSKSMTKMHQGGIKHPIKIKM